MIRDKELQLSNAQAVTVDAKSTNTIDLGPPSPSGDANGATERVAELLVTVDETVTADGAATVQIQLRSSASDDMSNPVIHELSPAIPKATLTAGALVPWKPRLPVTALRYVDVYFDVATGPLTAGKFTVDFVTSRQTNR